MAEKTAILTLKEAKEETTDIRLISMLGGGDWEFIPGQIAILSKEGIGESYFAIASAPEHKGSLEFLIRQGKGIAAVLYNASQGSQFSAKGPVGKGFPIDNFKGRDFLIAGVGTGIAPLRAAINSLRHRRGDFGKVAVLYGVRYPAGFCFSEEFSKWEQSLIKVVPVVSRPEGTDWKGRRGHVQEHFQEALSGLTRPVALICGMKAMIEESREKLLSLGIPPQEVLTNF